MSRALDARSTALETLQALRLRDAYADAALEGLFARHPELDARERALASQLVYGVLRWRNRLDAHLAGASSRPLHKLHPKVLDLLRVGAFQLLFLDRVPARAPPRGASARRRLPHAAGMPAWLPDLRSR